MTRPALYPHQRACLAMTDGRERAAYYLDMGLGKTFVASEKMLALGCTANLVLCQKSKIVDWAEHLHEHTDMRVYACTKAGLEKAVAMVSLGVPSCVVVNYELAWRRAGQLRSLMDGRRSALVLDESSQVQNPKAKQTRFVMSLSPSCVILLSGTPCSGKYENLWTQARLLGWDVSREAFEASYVNFKTVRVGLAFHKTVDMADPYRNVTRLRQKLREHGAVFMKAEDCVSLPPQTFTTVRIPMSDAYRRFLRDRVTVAGGKELAGSTTLTYRLYLRQLCGPYCDAKAQAFADLLASTNDRLVVFYNWVAERDLLMELCRKAGRATSRVDGERKDLSAYGEDPSSVTLCQYQAGAMGLNLQMADKAVYYSLPERSDLYEQSKARIHRIGQRRPCFYWLLVCEGSVEERIAGALRMRKDYTDELFRKDYAIDGGRR